MPSDLTENMKILKETKKAETELPTFIYNNDSESKLVSSLVEIFKHIVFRENPVKKLTEKLVPHVFFSKCFFERTAILSDIYAQNGLKSE